MAIMTSETTESISVPKHLAWFAGSHHQPETVPADLADRVPGVEFILREWREYHLTIPGAIALKIGNVWLQPIGASDTFIVSIANRLGLTDITPRYPDSLGETVYAEVLASKFPTLRDSLDFSQTMVDQLSARIRAMPFVVRAETSRQIIQEHGIPNLFFTFHLLRHNGDSVIRALSIIAADPHRKLSEIVENVRIHQAKRIDAEAMHSLLTGPRGGTPNQAIYASPIEQLQPLRISQRRPEETYNTPENRFVVAACRRLLVLMDNIQARPWWNDATDQDVAIFLNVRKSIRVLLHTDRFRGMEATMRIPAYSRVLQMKPGYRELTNFWSRLSQVHVPVLTRLSQAVDLRDVPTLYEYWQFFELAGAISEHTGVIASMKLRHDIYQEDWGLKAEFEGVGTLTTQRTFSDAETYTPVQLRPDFVWETVAGEKVVLDAKFAMTSTADLEIDGETVAASKASTRDITKMHGYRDAIRGVQAALVLYPGTRGEFWGANGESRPVDNLNEIIDAIVKCDLDGIGAVPLSPRMEG